ncbi:conserved hypothetical protein [Paraburkholderia piptadeniae]|uniref:DUF4393 domain-containing protein n=1 Tax=Paraburkholderia piptadeniae TaxID=1701573 RepID=A0A1N7S2Y0_9BURK|nr:conserved hypothetical protein [Paraburkholderia piptadeniae]
MDGERLVTEVAVEVAKTATNRVFNGLALICGPAAKELGQYFADQVRAWRANNAAQILDETGAIIESIEPVLSAQPRIVARVLEDGSWTDDPTLQSLWAGLLATSCTAEGGTDENLLFFDLLKNMTTGQARIIANVCDDMPIVDGMKYQVQADETIERSTSEWLDISGCTSVLELASSLQRLRTIGLIHPNGGHVSERSADDSVEVQPTPLCLHFYARARGHFGDLRDFYKIAGAT